METIRIPTQVSTLHLSIDQNEPNSILKSIIITTKGYNAYSTRSNTHELDVSWRYVRHEAINSRLLKSQRFEYADTYNGHIAVGHIIIYICGYFSVVVCHDPTQAHLNRRRCWTVSAVSNPETPLTPTDGDLSHNNATMMADK